MQNSLSNQNQLLGSWTSSCENLHFKCFQQGLIHQLLRLHVSSLSSSAPTHLNNNTSNISSPLPTRSEAVTAASSHLCLCDCLCCSPLQYVGLYCAVGPTHIEICYPAAMFKRHYLLTLLCLLARRGVRLMQRKPVSCFHCAHCISPLYESAAAERLQANRKPLFAVVMLHFSADWTLHDNKLDLLV